MHKGFISFAVLTVSLILFSSPAFCQVYHNDKYVPIQSQYYYNNAVLHNQQYTPVHKVKHKKYNKKYAKLPYYTQSNKTAYNPYIHNYNYNNTYKYNQKQPSIWQKIFNL